MSIIIHNIGGNPLGVSEYELCINERCLTTFKHDRSKGLAECLREAAKAMDRAKEAQICPTPRPCDAKCTRKENHEH